MTTRMGYVAQREGDELQLLTVREVVALTGLSRATLDRMAKKGIGPRRIKFGGRGQGVVRYRRGELHRWLLEVEG